MNAKLGRKIKLSHEEFLAKLEEVNPHYSGGHFKVVGRHDSARILTENKYGKCFSYYHDLLGGHNISIETALDKRQYFLNMLEDKNKNIFDKVRLVSGYEKFPVKMVWESEFGRVKITGTDILRAKTIGINSAEDKTEFMLKRFSLCSPLYASTDYSKFKYVSMSVKGVFVCKTHGTTYAQAISSHLNGNKGCHKCNKGVVFYNEDTVKQLDIYGKMYIVKMWDDKESFYKVGITSVNSEKRLKELRKTYNVNKILEIESNIRESYGLEQILLQYLEKDKYSPLKRFTGDTECVKVNPEIALVDIMNRYEEDKEKFDRMMCEDLCLEYEQCN